MTSDKKGTKQTLRALGIAMGFPLILAGGPIAGYLIGQNVLVQHFNAPDFFVLVLVGLGFLGSIFQIISLIKKINAVEATESQKDL